MTETVDHDDQAHADNDDAGDDKPSKESPIESRPPQYSELWWATVAAPTSRRCTASLSDHSGRCRKPCVPGQRVCTHHGGRAPQARRKAQQRLAEAADRMARELLKMATDDNVADSVKLAAIRDVLDRNGITAKTSVEIEVTAKPFEQVIDGISNQLEITSRSAHRATAGDDDPQHDESDPLADLIAQDLAHAQATARRENATMQLIRSNAYRDDDDVIDVSVVDVNDDGHPVTPGGYERQRDGRAATDPTRPGGFTGNPLDQAMTLEQGNEIAAELRARAARRAREAGHAVIRPAQRALPPGRS